MLIKVRDANGACLFNVWDHETHGIATILDLRKKIHVITDVPLEEIVVKAPSSKAVLGDMAGVAKHAGQDSPLEFEINIIRINMQDSARKDCFHSAYVLPDETILAECARKGLGSSLRFVVHRDQSIGTRRRFSDCAIKTNDTIAF
ncbi:hypothetical protein IW140_005377 [Coemansia sp. RSA 1813]|nr:hypothetical protein LPJ74_004405 [Coemansia sp. RSA 1843]KAJ2092237.1 hypothetical protein IW138_001304 [Coemansia sp. RSA 986]KAJ2565265.1 hypothetical protein IW140_005377 [Coemansia sp. RSA 1813]